LVRKRPGWVKERDFPFGKWARFLYVSSLEPKSQFPAEVDRMRGHRRRPHCTHYRKMRLKKNFRVGRDESESLTFAWRNGSVSLGLKVVDGVSSSKMRRTKLPQPNTVRTRWNATLRDSVILSYAPRLFDQPGCSAQTQLRRSTDTKASAMMLAC